ncbi:hypothetical protein BDZ45DRAFT_125900 [Acephala macrosclerotiorum]|nr:hypothetical protein BDZ45DRAFT_125900 [Acephala macrosclerotiorum]
MPSPGFRLYSPLLEKGDQSWARHLTTDSSGGSRKKLPASTKTTCRPAYEKSRIPPEEAFWKSPLSGLRASRDRWQSPPECRFSCMKVEERGRLFSPKLSPENKLYCDRSLRTEIYPYYPGHPSRFPTTLLHLRWISVHDRGYRVLTCRRAKIVSIHQTRLTK